MASMRDIKRRKESIQSTEQITKAMKLVSTVKVQKARQRVEAGKPYFDLMYKTVNEALSKAGTLKHPFLNERESKKKGVIVITSNRGLAGGYNNNVVKFVTANGFTPENSIIYNLGRKGGEGLKRNGFDITKDYSEVMEGADYEDAMEIGAKVLEAYMADEIGEIYVVYTAFKNMVSHEPTMRKLLPIDTEHVSENVSGKDKTDENPEDKAVMEFDSDESEILDVIVPQYVNSLIYGAIIDCVASENAARMQAMDNATSNADEMISDLSLKYNRARQSSITQELTEIIAGASAIG